MATTSESIVQRLGFSPDKRNAKDDLKRLRKELLSETSWHTSKWSFSQGIIATNLKTVADLFNDLMKLAPPTANAGAAIETGPATADRVLKAIREGKRIKEIADAEILQVMAKDFLKSRGNLGKGTKAALTLSLRISQKWSS